MITLDMQRIMIKMIKKIEFALIKSWWVAFFILGVFFVYERCINSLDEKLASLQNQIKELSVNIDNEKKKQMNMLLELDSHKDPRWIEMTLIKGLGLVPEGQIKIVFDED